MNVQDLSRLIADFVQVGYMQAVKTYDPPQDLVRKSEVRRWLKASHLPYAQFHRMEKAGLVTPFRKGEGRNSPLYYSKKEIKQAFATQTVAGLLTTPQP